MAKFNELDKVAKEHHIGGDSNILRIRDEGTWTLRIVSEYEVLQKFGYMAGKRWVINLGKDSGVVYPETEKTNNEFWMYVIDRNDDNKVKLFVANWTIVSGIRDLAEDADYAFDEKTGLPTYDIKVTKKLDGPASNPSSHKYSVLPGKGDTPLTEDEMGDIMELTPVEGVLQKMKDKELDRIKAGEHQDIGVVLGEGEAAPAEEEAPLPEEPQG